MPGHDGDGKFMISDPVWLSCPVWTTLMASANDCRGAGGVVTVRGEVEPAQLD